MPAPALLATKLFAPPARPDSVHRPRLAARLADGLAGGHVLVSAPAGFGKTTVVGQWIDATDMPVAWLSLDEADREPQRFLAYLVAALGSLEPDVGTGLARALRSSRPPSPMDAATELVNDLARGRGDIAVVLDDYHLAQAPTIDDVITHLIDYAPPRLHLVLTTREDPALPLARLRARGRLTELRSEDLRFEGLEAATLLARATGRDLASDLATRLEAATEGWAAGLHLAAVSLRRRDDVEAFVDGFAGRHRHVFDYLSDEVLQGLDPDVRAFLFACSVLERLSAPLCDAVTGRDDGADMLERLERANLFLVPLDDERRWYRFHALFADVLRASASRELGDGLRTAHERACAWLEDRDAPGEAIAHALAADDPQRAARILERAWRGMDRGFQVPTWRRWAEPIPDEILRSRPVLAVAMAWAHLDDGAFEPAAAWLSEGERGLATSAAPHGSSETGETRGAPTHRPSSLPTDLSEDPVAFRALPARIEAARAYVAQATGDLAAGEAHARRAVDLAPDDDPGARSLPAGLLGLSAWWRGDLEQALVHLRMAMQGFRSMGDAAAALSFAFGIADVLRIQGRLRDAIATFDEALRYADAQRGPTLPGESEAHIGLAEVLIEQGDVEGAERELRAGEALGDAGVSTGDEARLAAARAIVHFALGNAEAAHARLDEAADLEIAGPVPVVRPPGAIRARLWLAEGRLAEARAWADTLGAPAGLESTHLDDYAHLTVARVLLSAYRSGGDASAARDALALLDRIRGAAQATGRRGPALEARVLRALALQACGDDTAAVDAVRAALVDAEPEGYLAVFVDEGPAMAKLVRSAARTGPGRRAARRVLTRLEGAGAQRRRVLPDLVDALSDRERDVLRMLRSDLNGPQIARELGMSVHTFRSHTKSIYAKLGVHGRGDAVQRAGELDLV